MKKIFKKSLACLIAVLMIVSSLPFATLTANAAETKSASVMKYGTIVKTNCTNRATGTALTIVNDNKDDNFDIGFVTFDVSNLSSTVISKADYTFNVSAVSGRENLGLTLWYPTDHYDAFANSGNPNTADSAYAGDGTTSKKVDHITPAKNYFGMKHIKDLVLSTDSPRFNSAYSGTHTVDISSALQYAVDNNKDYAVVCFMLTNNGAHDDSNGWSDTIVTVNTNNISVDITTDITAVKQYVKNNISSFNGYKGTAKYIYNGTDLSNGYSDYYSNLLYDDGKFEDNTNPPTHSKGGVKCQGKLYINHDVVLMYDGINETVLPVVATAYANNTFRFIDCICDISTEKWELKENWKGSAGSWSGWPTSTSELPKTKTKQENFRINSESEFRNKLKYNSTGNTTDYYEQFSPTNNQIKFSLGYHSSYFTDTHEINYFDIYDPDSTVYVVNYQPIADKISAMKNVYNTIMSNGEDKYCADYLENFYKAAYKVMTLNPNSYSYSSGVATAVQKVAGDIEDVVTNYLTTATTEPSKHTEVTVDGKEATCTETGLTEGKKCSHCGVTLVAQTTISATGHEYTYTYVDKTHHTKKCTKGDFEEQEEHTLGTDGKCTLCKGTVIDYSAWNKAAEESAPILTSGASTYTAESFNEYYELYKSALAVRQSATTQAEVDKATAMLLSAQTVLRKKSVTVTLQKVGANDTPTTIKTYENHEYGTALEIDLATVDSSIKNVEKWTISTDNGATTTKLSSTDTKLTLFVTKSATVTVYEVDEPTDSETVKYSKVVFLGKNGVVVDIKYVKQDDTKTPAELGVTVPTVPFYTSDGWDNESITGTGKTIYVRAKYTASPKDEDMCNVHFRKWSRKYSYDSFVRPEGIDPSKQYALASDAEGKNIITYLEGVDFYAPKTIDIYVVEVSERVAKTGITGHFKGSDDTHRWATYNCKFYLPKDCTAIEWGLEVAVGKQKQLIKAEYLSKGNEYTVNARVKKDSSLHSVTCRSYVTYKQNGETKTIYSDVAVKQDF